MSTMYGGPARTRLEGGCRVPWPRWHRRPILAGSLTALASPLHRKGQRLSSLDGRCLSNSGDEGGRWTLKRSLHATEGVGREWQTQVVRCCSRKLPVTSPDPEPVWAWRHSNPPVIGVLCHCCNAPFVPYIQVEGRTDVRAAACHRQAPVPAARHRVRIPAP